MSNHDDSLFPNLKLSLTSAFIFHKSRRASFFYFVLYNIILLRVGAELRPRSAALSQSWQLFCAACVRNVTSRFFECILHRLVADHSSDIWQVMARKNRRKSKWCILKADRFKCL